MRRLLAITMLAMIFTASAQDDAEPEQAPPPPARVISCSVIAPAARGGCYVETRILTLADLEVAIGFDVDASLREQRVDAAPYLTASWYAERWSVGVQLLFPKANLPVLGSPDFLRVFWTMSF